MASTRRFRTALLGAILACHCALLSQYDPTAPEPIPRLRGTVFIGGGGELPGEIYDRFVEMAGGTQTKLVVLGSAPPPKSAIAEWKQRKVSSVATLHTGSREDASSANWSKPLSGATAVWITGNDPATFARLFRGTPVEAGLRGVIARGGVVGANGAVARALTKVMITTGNPHATVGTGLDLVPGAVIDDRYTGKSRRHRLLGVIAAQPALVGLGIDEETAMVLHQRFIDVLGKGSVHACVTGSEKRLLRIDRINRRESPASQKRTTRRRGQRSRRPRGRRGRRQRSFRSDRLADLIALSRSAQARVAPTFPGYAPEPPNVKAGTLVIVGGGGMPKGLMERFVEFAGGVDAPLVYIPCEEREKIDREPRMLKAWRRAGVKHVDWIHTKDRNAANHDEKLLAKLRKAKGIWFGGGRQWNLVDSYQNTTAHKLMHDVLKRGGVIGGSSAGASIQASYMARGNPVGNLDAMAEGYETGLGFLTGVAIDQHFTQRGRLRDMTGLVDTYPEVLGIGLDEASSIIVRGTVAEVITREGRNVHIYDRTKPVIPGQEDHAVLVHGQRYDLQKRRLLEQETKK